MKRPRRVAIAIEYDGSEFVGWQRQRSGRSVQAEVEAALSRVADESIAVVAAGRTDSGVHARVQVAHFDTTRTRASHHWVLGANRYLPGDVAVHWARAVPGSFHARFSAVARCYRYSIREGRVRPVLERKRCGWVTGRLDLAAMRAGAAWLRGEHDFSAFRAAGCEARSPWRNVTRLALWRAAGALRVEVEANSFLQHMVRNIVGSLTLVGRGKKPPEWMAQVLAGRDRRRAGPAAPPHGLELVAVRYPEGVGLPARRARGLLESVQD